MVLFLRELKEIPCDRTVARVAIFQEFKNDSPRLSLRRGALKPVSVLEKYRQKSNLILREARSNVLLMREIIHV